MKANKENSKKVKSQNNKSKKPKEVKEKPYQLKGFNFQELSWSGMW